MNADYQYLVGHVQSALATDPRANMLDVKVMIIGNRIHLIGEASSTQRRQAVTDIVTALCPGIQIRNELTILELGGPKEPEAIGD